MHREVWAGFAALCSAAAIAQTGVRPGLWEVATRTEFGGNKNNVPALISRLCIDTEQADNPRAWTPRFQGGATCNIRDYVLQNGEANWNYVCQGEPATFGTGRLRIQLERYEGSNNLELRRGEERMKVVQLYEGRRIGECEGAR